MQSHLKRVNFHDTIVVTNGLVIISQMFQLLCWQLHITTKSSILWCSDSLRIYPTSFNALQDGDDDEDVCPWAGTIYPLWNDDPSFGIASIGRKLSHGTWCKFELIYRMSVDGDKPKNVRKLSNCTGKCIIMIVVFCDAKKDLCFSWWRVWGRRVQYRQSVYIQ